jgi:hypothetical protein
MNTLARANGVGGLAWRGHERPRPARRVDQADRAVAVATGDARSATDSLDDIPRHRVGIANPKDATATDLAADGETAWAAFLGVARVRVM